MKRKILSSIMALVMIVSMLPFSVFAEEGDTWAESASTEWYTGDGDEYTISSAADLAGLAQLVNGGNDFSGKTIKIGTDIDLEGKEWTPIGTKDYPFKGTFDGTKEEDSTYTISNLKIDDTELTYAGLFGNLNTPGAIKNLTIQNAQVTGKASVGALAGSAFTGSVSGCTVMGLIAISGNYKVGGLARRGLCKSRELRCDRRRRQFCDRDLRKIQFRRR